MTRLVLLGTTMALLVAAVFLPWRGQPGWVWALLLLTRNRKTALAAPITVANDRSSGGVRYQSGVVTTAIHLIGKPHCATLLIGSTMSHTENTLELGTLMTVLRTNLGMTFQSASLVSAGSRRRSTGDYPRIYDSFIGSSPYAGRRDTWLVLRINTYDNAEQIRLRTTAGAGALAATQRVAAALSCRGVRARVATASEIVALDRHLGGGCLTSYSVESIDAETVAMPWSLRVDRVITNLTVFPDSTVTSTLTIGTPQPPSAPPSTALRPFPGQQVQLLGRHLCGPLPRVYGLARQPLPEGLAVPLGSSGVLLGKIAVGDRLLMPLDHPGGHSHVHIEADDAIAKRIVIRAVAAGAQVTVHTTDTQRWSSLRMPNIFVTDQPRPASGTTVSVTDGTVHPSTRPGTVITQTGPATVTVRTGQRAHDVEMDFFRAENRYAA